jgi:hypothetical protein
MARLDADGDNDTPSPRAQSINVPSIYQQSRFQEPPSDASWHGQH